MQNRLRYARMVSIACLIYLITLNASTVKNEQIFSNKNQQFRDRVLQKMNHQNAALQNKSAKHSNLKNKSSQLAILKDKNHQEAIWRNKVAQNEGSTTIAMLYQANNPSVSIVQALQRPLRKYSRKTLKNRSLNFGDENINNDGIGVGEYIKSSYETINSRLRSGENKLNEKYSRKFNNKNSKRKRTFRSKQSHAKDRRLKLLRRLQLQRPRWQERQIRRKELLERFSTPATHSLQNARMKRFLANSFVSRLFRYFAKDKKAHKFKSKSKLAHFQISISKSDVFISRYGIYVFIPFMMFYTVLYILLLKWRFLDTDPMGVEAAAHIFEKAGRKIMVSTNPGLRKDPRTGKMFFLPGYEKDEEAGIQDIIREVTVDSDMAVSK